MKQEIANNAETAERAADVVSILTSAFESLVESGSVQVKHGKSQVFKVVFGWWAGITRSSEAVTLLHKTGLAHESAPIARSILQHALVLQWVVDTGDDALEVIREYADNNRRNLINTLQTAGWPPPVGTTTDTPPKPANPHSSINKIKIFDQLCIAYGAEKLYVAYRLLSGLSHPTASSAEAYIDESGTLNSHATTESHSFLIQTALCLIQTAQVVTRLLMGDPLHDAIATAQERLGAEITPWPSPSSPASGTQHGTGDAT